jgi:Resolvase, N terminal domain
MRRSCSVVAKALDKSQSIAICPRRELQRAAVRRPACSFRLLGGAHLGDVLLVEQVDRLYRLLATDWERLKSELAARKVRVVALDLPTSWTMATGKTDNFTARMFEAINGMLLDKTRPWHARITKIGANARCRPRLRLRGKYVGQPEDKCRNIRIAAMLAAGTAYSPFRKPGLQQGHCGQDRKAREGRRLA